MSSLEEDWKRYAEAIKKGGSDVLVLTNYEYKKLLGAVSHDFVREIINHEKFCGLPIVIEE